MKDFIELFEGESSPEEKKKILAELSKLTARDFLVRIIATIIHGSRKGLIKDLFTRRFDVVAKTWGLKKSDIVNSVNHPAEYFKEEKGATFIKYPPEILKFYLINKGIDYEAWFKSRGREFEKGIFTFYKMLLNKYDSQMSKVPSVYKSAYVRRVHESYIKYKRDFKIFFESGFGVPYVMTKTLRALTGMMFSIILVIEAKEGNLYNVPKYYRA